MGYPQCVPFEVCKHEAYVAERKRMVQTCEDYEDPTKPTPIVLTPEQSQVQDLQIGLNAQQAASLSLDGMPTVAPESLPSLFISVQYLGNHS